MLDDDEDPQVEAPLTGDLVVDAADVDWPRRLAAAVIRQALFDARSSQAHVRQAALVFFTADSSLLVGWCRVAGLEPTAVRTRVRQQLGAVR